MSSLGQAVISFSAETAKFTADVGRAAHMFEKNMLGMQRAVDGLLGKLGIAGGIAGIALLTKGAIELGDQTFKASQKIGISTEKLSELAFAFKLADVDQQQMVMGLGKFNQALVNAGNTSSKESKIFRALGIDITKGPLAAFRQLADVMSKMPKDSPLISSLSKALMGRGGMEMIPGMLDGSKGFDEAAQKARNLGLVVGEEFARASQQFNDNMKILESRATSLGMSIAKYLLPVLNDVVARLAKAAEHGRGAFVAETGNTIMRGAASFIKGLSDVTGIPLHPITEERFQSLFNEGDQQHVSGRIRGMPKPEFVGPPRPTTEQLAALAKALASNDEAARAAAAELKRFESAAQVLEQKLGALNEQTEEQSLRYQLLKGSLKGLTEPHQQHLIALAKEIDQRKQALMVSDLIGKSYDEMRARIDELNRAQTGLVESNRQLIEQMEFEASMIGKTARQQEILNFQRELGLRLQADLARAAQTAGDDMAQYDAARTEIMDLHNQTLQRGVEIIQQRQEVERDWSTGVERAFKDYAEAASDGATIANNMVTSAFQGMEDALVKFVQGGKINFKDFANSVISDIIRIQARMALAEATKSGGGLLGSLAKGIGSVLGFGGGLGYGSAGTAAGTAMVSNGAGGFVAALADGGDFMAGRPIMVGEEGPELMLPRMAGTVIPNDALGGGTMSVTIYQTNNIDSRSDMASVIAAMRSAKDEAVAEIYDRFSRGERA